MLHILPRNDIQEHEESTCCACRPRVECEGAEILVVHNSFDGREMVEQAPDILEETCD